jgi:hypothetical protein
MLIYGTKNKEIAKEHLSTNALSVGHRTALTCMYSKGMHTFIWIPFFPIGKTGVSIQCDHCKQV